jgi:tetratricopeptide (TPR) repeat protein/transcriptional regulator with XRE-family HTH domain
MSQTFAYYLTRFRQRRGLTKSALAEALGATRMSIIDWEAGRRVPRDQARLLDLAQVLQLTPSEAEHLIMAARQHSAAATSPAQAAAPQGAADPLTMARPHQLRPSVADFVGRDIETAQLVAALRAALTRGCGACISGVLGMGGIGKTELAYAVAHQLRDAFPNAQLVLQLQGTSAAPLTAEQTLQAAIRAFTPNAKLPDDLPALEGLYRTALHGQRALILADDAYDAAQVRPLLPPAGSALLITSRTRLTLPGMATVHLEPLGSEQAVLLLRMICPRLREAEAQALALACAYLPLALRVSGGILHTSPALPVATYLARLKDERKRLNQLRDPNDKQLDVAATLALSYAQLDPIAQQVFRQLGVLVGDFSTELALAVVDPSAELDAEATLHQLLRRNLLMYDTARSRWRLHDLVRDLAWRYLTELGEEYATGWRYAQAGVRLAQAIDALYLAGGDSLRTALERFDKERPHIDAARHWASQYAGAPAVDTLILEEMIATRNIALLRYSVQHEQFPRLEQALAAARRLGDRRGEGIALDRLALAYAQLGDVQQSIAYGRQALASAQALGDRHGQARAFNNLGCAYMDLGDPARAIPYHEQELTIALEIGDGRSQARSLSNIGSAYGKLGDAARAIPYFEQALEVVHALGEWRGESIILCELGECYVVWGEPQHAIDCCRRALTITRNIQSQRHEGYVWCILGRAYAAQGQQTQTSSAFARALALFHEIGDRRGVAECSWHYGLVLAVQGDRTQALPLLREGVAYEQAMGYVQAAEHAALLARLEAGEQLPPEWLRPGGQRVVGADQSGPAGDAALP